IISALSHVFDSTTTHTLFFCYLISSFLFLFFFFLNATSTTEIYTLSLHDALPISVLTSWARRISTGKIRAPSPEKSRVPCCGIRSEEHTSELQSRVDLVCRLLLEKKKNKKIKTQRRKTKVMNNVKMQHTTCENYTY